MGQSAPTPVLGPRSKYKNSAAFYDVDGTLIKINIVHAFAYYQARHPSLIESAVRTIKTGASIPVFWAADKLSRKWFNEIFYRQYEGASEDRLVVLAEELFEDVIKPNIYPRATELIDESRRAGVLTASTGNHGVAVARAGGLAGVPVKVYVSNVTVPTKTPTNTSIACSVCSPPVTV